MIGQNQIDLQNGGVVFDSSQTLKSNLNSIIELQKIISTSFGPNSSDKLFQDKDSEVFLSNDGATIVKCLKIQHPCAKLFVDLSSTQSKKFGDGTTTAMLYSSELLKISYELVHKENYSIEEISKKFHQAKQMSIKFLKENSKKLNQEILLNAIKTVLISKQIRYEIDLFTKLMLDAVKESQIQENIEVMSLNGNLKESELIEGYLLYHKDIDYFEARKDAKIAFVNIPMFKSSTHLQFENSDFIALQDELIEIEADVILCTREFPYEECSFTNQNVLIFEHIDEEVIEKISHKFQLPISRSLKILDIFTCQNMKYYDKNHFILNFSQQKISTILVKAASFSSQEEAQRVIDYCIKLILNSSELVVSGGGAIEIALYKNLRNFSNDKEDEIIFNFAKMFLIVPKLLLESCGLNIYENMNILKETSNSKMIGVNATKKKLMDTLENGIMDYVDSKISIIELSIETILMILKIDQIIFCGQTK
eukprot:gene2338-2806_t